MVELGRVRFGLAALGRDEDEEVFRLVELLVERRRGNRERPEWRSARRRVEDPLDHELALLTAREQHLDRGTDAEVVILRVVLVGERSVIAERVHRLL